MTTIKEDLVKARAYLRQLRREHPTWSLRQLAKETERCLTWVKKWLARFKLVAPDDEKVLWGLPTVPKTPKKQPDPILLDRIEAMRETPPGGLKRTPGPKTLLYYLARDALLLQKGIAPPRSTSTVWRYLLRLGFLARPGLRKRQPLERAEPGTAMATDFKDSSCLTVEPDGKKQHLIETMNFIDEGTSYWWAAVVRTDFNAETVIETLFEVFGRTGLPRSLRFDRDPRFVGAAQGRDFPSAMVRLLHVLGVQPLISPPRRPDKNPFVERLNKNYGFECLAVHQPDSVGRVKEVTEEYRLHYNNERPHQGKSCSNKPPTVAFPEFAPSRPLPLLVDPDSWLLAVDGEHFTRKVEVGGGISVDKYDYYVGRECAGKYVVVKVVAAAKELEVYHKGQLVKHFPIRGLYRQAMTIVEYQKALTLAARAERRGWRPQV